MNKCIWCGKFNQDKDIEHIIPEALGCPKDFFLDNGIVCKKCNNNLAYLDRAVIGDFEIPAFLAGVTKKKNKSPKVSSYGNVKATVEKFEKKILINMGRNNFTFPGGEKVAPYRGRERDIKASMSNVKSQPSISFSYEVGKSRKFHRGIIKIAFSILAKAFGTQECNQEKYNPIRKFVRSGKGEIPLLMFRSESNEYITQSYNPMVSENGNYMIRFRIFVMEFVVDFARDSCGFYQLRKVVEEMYGKKSYSYLPLDI